MTVSVVVMRVYDWSCVRAHTGYMQSDRNLPTEKIVLFVGVVVVVRSSPRSWQSPEVWRLISVAFASERSYLAFHYRMLIPSVINGVFWLGVCVWRLLLFGGRSSVSVVAVLSSSFFNRKNVEFGLISYLLCFRPSFDLKSGASSSRLTVEGRASVCSQVVQSMFRSGYHIISLGFGIVLKIYLVILACFPSMSRFVDGVGRCPNGVLLSRRVGSTMFLCH